VEAVRDYAVDEAFFAVVLHVDYKNISAAKLYEREGFEQYSGDDADDEVCMILAVNTLHLDNAE